MILLIPNIDITQGMCSEKIKGVEGTDELYDYLKCNPDELIKLIRRENAKSVNIVDIDSFSNEDYQTVKMDNKLSIDTIKYVCRNTDIPIQLESFVSNSEEVDELFELGIYRLIVKNNLRSNVLNKNIINKYGSSKISLILDIDDFLDLEILLETIFINYMEFKNLRVVLDLKHSDLFVMENMNEYFSTLLSNNSIIKKNNFKFTLKNFVKNSEELYSINQLEKFNIDSVIIGTELNNNIFPCQNIWRNIESKLEKIEYKN